ncbi:MAG: glycosyltransferase [Clostridia bacterium]|nr:glycosyltransferase [Clostridia bacterium]MDR3643480.1 glycosyltransferase [Clostridia bacterium]
MKVLILSTKTGEGHNSASKAVADYINTRGDCEAVVADILKSGNKNVSGSVSNTYAFVTTYIPWFFRFLYSLGALISSPKHHSPIYYLNSLYSKELMRKIGEIGPDVILCPHIFSAQAITYLKLVCGLETPAAGLVTDYTCSPFWEETRLEKYVIPSRVLREEFIKKGIPAEKLAPIGIPVCSRFKSRRSKQEARAAFGLSAEHVFVIMGGSMGYGRIPQLAGAIHERMPDAQVVAVCGNNRNLAEKMRAQAPENLVVMDFVDDIEVLMDAADVLLTKPGGLSSTEALTKRVPIVLTDPIPCGEEMNARFLSSLGVAVFKPNIRDAADAAVALVRAPEGAAAMLRAQEEYFDRDTDIHVGELLISMAKAGGKELCQ